MASYAGRELPNVKLEDHLDLAYELGVRDRRNGVPAKGMRTRIRKQYGLVGTAVQMYQSGFNRSFTRGAQA
jgi:hypothetical protein